MHPPVQRGEIKMSKVEVLSLGEAIEKGVIKPIVTSLKDIYTKLMDLYQIVHLTAYSVVVI